MKCPFWRWLPGSCRGGPSPIIVITAVCQPDAQRGLNFEPRSVPGMPQQLSHMQAEPVEALLARKDELIDMTNAAPHQASPAWLICCKLEEAAYIHVLSSPRTASSAFPGAWLSARDARIAATVLIQG
jgi:hypothetical protein